jgi:hypothetical protein
MFGCAGASSVVEQQQHLQQQAPQGLTWSSVRHSDRHLDEKVM